MAERRHNFVAGASNLNDCGQAIAQITVASSPVHSDANATRNDARCLDPSPRRRSNRDINVRHRFKLSILWVIMSLKINTNDKWTLVTFFLTFPKLINHFIRRRILKSAYIGYSRIVYSFSWGWKDCSYFLSPYAYPFFLESKPGRISNSVFEWQQAT